MFQIPDEVEYPSFTKLETEETECINATTWSIHTDITKDGTTEYSVNRAQLFNYNNTIRIKASISFDIYVGVLIIAFVIVYYA